MSQKAPRGPGASDVTRVDASTADPLVATNLGLVYDVAAQLMRDRAFGLEKEDLVGAGVRGLIQAARAFDASRGLAFSTFAVARIRGAMLDEVRRWDKTPRSIRERQRRIKSCQAALRAKLGREPTPVEVASAIGVPLEELHRWQLELRRREEESLDAFEGGAHALRVHEGEGRAWPSEGDDPIEQIGRDQAIGILRQCLKELPEREQRILALYYFEGLRLREIAQILGVTESRVSQVRQATLQKLRNALSQRGVE